MSRPMSRRYDIDWLRTLATLVIFLFHNARFFNEEDWHVKNNTLDFGMSVFVSFLVQWIMPLFFLLSAYAVWFALDRRTNRQFLQERLSRLVIPLVFGIFTLIPPQVYIERLTHHQYYGSFIKFLPHYFDGWYGFGGNFAWMGLHLWYLLMLFLFSMLALPLLRGLKTTAGSSLIRSLADFFARPGLVFLLALPLGIVEVLVNLQPEGVGLRDFGGWSPFSYLAIFLLGYLLASDDRFRQAIYRQRVLSLLAGLAATVLGFWLALSEQSDTYNAAFSLLRAFNSWSWLLALLGFASQWLNFTNPTLKYTSEISLPFYILHQSIIVITGYFLIDWHVGVLPKYLALAGISFTIILGLVHFVIRPVNVMRLLFGMRPKT